MDRGPVEGIDGVPGTQEGACPIKLELERNENRTGTSIFFEIENSKPLILRIESILCCISFIDQAYCLRQLFQVKLYCCRHFRKKSVVQV